MSFEISLSGFKKRIKVMQEMAGHRAIDMVNELSGIGEAQAKALAPVDSGELRTSIVITPATIKADGIVEGSWGTNNDHALFQEYGTGQKGMSGIVANDQPKDPDAGVTYREDWPGIPARPYMYPATKLVEEVMPGIVAKYAGKFLGGDK